MEMLPDKKRDNIVGVHDHILKMIGVKRKLHKEANENIGKAQKRYKYDYDKKRATTTV